MDSGVVETRGHGAIRGLPRDDTGICATGFFFDEAGLEDSGTAKRLRLNVAYDARWPQEGEVEPTCEKHGGGAGPSGGDAIDITTLEALARTGGQGGGAMSAAELVMAAAVIARRPKQPPTLPWSQRLTSGDSTLMAECVAQFARTLENAPPPGSLQFAELHRELTVTFSRMLNPQLLPANLGAVRNVTMGIGDAMEKGLIFVSSAAPSAAQGCPHSPDADVEVACPFLLARALVSVPWCW